MIKQETIRRFKDTVKKLMKKTDYNPFWTYERKRIGLNTAAMKEMSRYNSENRCPSWEAPSRSSSVSRTRTGRS